jgi:hypothetical protein
LADAPGEVVTMLGDLLVIFGLGALVLSPFAFFQIITKAGYSGWWTFVPYSPWIVGLLGAGVFRTVDTNQSIGTTLNQLGLWDVFMLLTGVFVMIMFFIFAFSAWPSLQQRRPGQGVPPGSPRGGSGQPSWINASAPAAPGPVGASPPAPSQSQPSGWYRTGAVGAGEEGYWDGQAWTARRQWKNGAWVDLPMVTAGPAEAGTAGTVGAG